MDPDTIFGATIVFLNAVWIWDTYVAYRQYCVYVSTTKLPASVADLMDAASFDKSRAYRIDKTRFAFAHSIYSHVESMAVLLFGIIPLLWSWAVNVAGVVGVQSELVQSAIFMVIVLTGDSILAIPWSAYDNFVIEQKHGFNKQTPDFFMKDKLKKMLVTSAIAVPVTVAVVAIVQYGGDYFFLYVWAALSVFLLVSVIIVIGSITMQFMLTIYPEFIAPLFDKYAPLPDGELRTKIEALAARLEFPLTKLYVVEGSKRSAHSNAYLFGFWNNKRIVLYDTLLEDYTPVQREEEENKEGDDESKKETVDESKHRKLGMSTDEVVAVLGHELGHWAKWHVATNLLITEANLFLLFYGFGIVYMHKEIYDAFGFYDAQPTIIGLLIIFQYIFAPYNEILNVAMTVMTRYKEFQADEFSAQLGYADKLSSALIKLLKDNLSFPVDDWLYSWINHSHPPVKERVEAIKKYL